MRAYQDLVDRLHAARKAAGTSGEDQIAALAAIYGNFAVSHRPEVELLFQSGLVHAEHDALAALDAVAYQEYRAAADATGVTPDRADDLVFATAALAHGFSTLQVAASANYAMSGDTL